MTDPNMPPHEPPTSANVQKVIETLKENPDLVQEMTQVLTRVYERAAVPLTQGEKAELFFHIGSLIKWWPVIA